MAKVVGPLHSSEARGSVGSLTYNTWRGISIVKARAGPTTQYSDAQVALRALAALATTSWQSITDAQRNAWHDYANTHTDIDWTGNPQRLSGYNWYIRINVRRQLLGQAIGTSPPTIVYDSYVSLLTAVDIPPGLSISFSTMPGFPAFTEYVELYGHGPHSPGRNIPIQTCSRIIAMPLGIGPYTWILGANYGWYTIFARPMHIQGVVAGWAKTKAEYID